MGVKNFSHTHRSTMCGLKKLASQVFSESWEVLAERRRRRRTKNNSPPVTRGDLITSEVKLWISIMSNGALDC